MLNNIFTENSNKAMLWDILEESFSNLNNNDYNEFKIFFDKHIHESDGHLNNENIIELIEKNKFFIKNTLSLINNNQWKEKYNIVKTNELYTSSDLQQNRMSEFEKKFTERQSEFSNLINLNKPVEISFEDNNQEIPLYDIQSKIKEIEAEREQMLINTNYITHDIENDSKKIKILEESKKKITINNLIKSSDVNNLIESSDVNNLIESSDVNNLIEPNNVNNLIEPNNVNNLIEPSDVKKKVTFNNLVDIVNINNEVKTLDKYNINYEIDNIKKEINLIKDLIQDVNFNILKMLDNSKKN